MNKSSDLKYYNTETNFYKNNNNNNSKILYKSYSILEFEKSNILSTQIKSKNHIHGLVLLLSNMNWNCKICLKYYTKDYSSYYCSLCNYNVCDNCIGYNKKYPLKIYYHEQNKLKEFLFSCHKHSMIY